MPLGDSTWDGVFNADDLQTVYQAGRYATGEVAGWAEGDWNHIGVFTSQDMIAAMDPIERACRMSTIVHLRTVVFKCRSRFLFSGAFEQSR